MQQEKDFPDVTTLTQAGLALKQEEKNSGTKASGLDPRGGSLKEWTQFGGSFQS